MALSNLYVVLKTGWSLGVTITACILAFAFFRGAPRGSGSSRPSVRPAREQRDGVRRLVRRVHDRRREHGRPPGARDAHRRAARRRAPRRVVRRDRRARRLRRHPREAAAREPRGAPVPHRHRDRGDDPRPPRPGRQGSGQARLLGGAGAPRRGDRLAEGRARGVDAVPPPRAPSGCPFTLAGLPAARWGLAVETSVLLVGSRRARLLPDRLVDARSARLLTYGVLAPAMVARGVIEAVSYARHRPVDALGRRPRCSCRSGLVDVRLPVAERRGVVRRPRPRAVAARGRGTRSRSPPSRRRASLVRRRAPRPRAGHRRCSCARCSGSRSGWGRSPCRSASCSASWRRASPARPTRRRRRRSARSRSSSTAGSCPASSCRTSWARTSPGGIGLHAADLLTDLKSGYLLGARPRPQLAAQLLGTVVGAAAIVPVFDLLVPDASVLGSEKLPGARRAGLGGRLARPRGRRRRAPPHRPRRDRRRVGARRRPRPARALRCPRARARSCRPPPASASPWSSPARARSRSSSARPLAEALRRRAAARSRSGRCSPSRPGSSPARASWASSSRSLLALGAGGLSVGRGDRRRRVRARDARPRRGRRSSRAARRTTRRAPSRALGAEARACSRRPAPTTRAEALAGVRPPVAPAPRTTLFVNVHAPAAAARSGSRPPRRRSSRAALGPRAWRGSDVLLPRARARRDRAARVRRRGRARASVGLGRPGARARGRAGRRTVAAAALVVRRRPTSPASPRLRGGGRPARPGRPPRRASRRPCRSSPSPAGRGGCELDRRRPPRAGGRVPGAGGRSDRRRGRVRGGVPARARARRGAGGGGSARRGGGVDRRRGVGGERSGASARRSRRVRTAGAGDWRVLYPSLPIVRSAADHSLASRRVSRPAPERRDGDPGPRAAPGPRGTRWRAAPSRSASSSSRELRVGRTRGAARAWPVRARLEHRAPELVGVQEHRLGEVHRGLRLVGRDGGEIVAAVHLLVREPAALVAEDDRGPPLRGTRDRLARDLRPATSRRLPRTRRELVPTTQAQSATASSSVRTSRGRSSSSSACTATRRAVAKSCVPSSAIAQSARPKFFIARATAPRFSGLRGRTSTRRTGAPRSSPPPLVSGAMPHGSARAARRVNPPRARNPVRAPPRLRRRRRLPLRGHRRDRRGAEALRPRRRPRPLARDRARRRAPARRTLPPAGPSPVLADARYLVACSPAASPARSSRATCTACGSSSSLVDALGARRLRRRRRAEVARRGAAAPVGRARRDGERGRRRHAARRPRARGAPHLQAGRVLRARGARGRASSSSRSRASGSFRRSPPRSPGSRSRSSCGSSRSGWAGARARSRPSRNAGGSGEGRGQERQHDPEHVVEVEGSVNPLAARLAAARFHGDDRQAVPARLGAERPQERLAAEPRHPDVEDHDRRRGAGAEAREGVVAVGRHDHLRPAVLERRREPRPHVRVRLDHQHSS